MYCLTKYPESLKNGLSRKIRENIIFPIIGDKTLKKTQTVYFSEIKSQLMACYSRFTCGDTMKKLYIIFQIACSEGRIKCNPVTQEQVYVAKKTIDSHNKRRLLSEEQLENLNRAIPFSEHKDLLSLGFTTGITMTYIQALKWEDVDLYSGQLIVCRRFYGYGENRQEKYLSPDKIRIMKLPPFVVEYLLERYDKMLITRKNNHSFNAGNYIFTNRDGMPVNNHYINSAAYKLGVMAGVEELTYTDLVHNALNNAIRCGISVNYIMDYYSCSNQIEDLKNIYLNNRVRRACNE